MSVHIKCNKFENKDYITFFQGNEHLYFYCIKCLADTLPLLNLNNNQFNLTGQGIDFPEEVTRWNLLKHNTVKHD